MICLSFGIKIKNLNIPFRDSLVFVYAAKTKVLEIQTGREIVQSQSVKMRALFKAAYTFRLCGKKREFCKAILIKTNQDKS